MTGKKAVVRLLTQQEWGQASAVVWRVFSQFVAAGYPLEGIQAFRQFVEPETLGALARRGKLRLWGCFPDGALAGVGAMRDGSHISLLFVDGSQQRKGRGSALIHAMLRWCCKTGAQQVTVNAAPNAAGFYRRLGFIPQGEEQVSDGIRFTPMFRSLLEGYERVGDH